MEYTEKVHEATAHVADKLKAVKELGLKGNARRLSEKKRCAFIFQRTTGTISSVELAKGSPSEPMSHIPRLHNTLTAFAVTTSHLSQQVAFHFSCFVFVV